MAEDPAKLLRAIAGVARFATDAKLARTVGAAPIPGILPTNPGPPRSRRQTPAQLALQHLTVTKGR